MKKILILFTALCLLQTQGISQCTWGGTTSSNWGTASNWAGTGCLGITVPDAADIVTIPSGATFEPDISAVANALSISVDAGAVLTISSSTLTITLLGDATINGTLTIASGGTLNGGGTSGTLTLSSTSIINLGGNNFPGSFFTETIDVASETVYNGAAQTIDATTTYGNLTIAGSGIKILTGNIAIDGNLTVTTGVLDIDAYTVTGQVGKTLDIQDATRLVLSGASNFPTGFGTYNFNATSTVDYDLNGAQTIAEYDYANLDLTGGGTKSIADNDVVGVSGILDIENNATLATNGPNDVGADQMIRIKSTGETAGTTGKIDDLSDESLGTITGAGVICERYINLTGPDKTGWNDWASPIESFKLASWYYGGWPMTGVPGIIGSDFPSNPFKSVLTYDANISTPYFVFTNDGVVDKNDGWVPAISITNAYNPGVGFRLYTGARDRVIEDIGLPEQGAVVVNLNYTDDAGAADAEEGWNLIGNPYMCTIDFDLLNFSGVAETDYEDGFWVYSNATGYYVYKESVGTGTAPFDVLDNTTVAPGLISSHKAFWVKVRSGSQTVTFNENDKITAGTTFIKNTIFLPKVRMQVKNLNTGDLSAGLLTFKADASLSYDRYDADILRNAMPTAPNLFMIAADDRELSINTVPTDQKVEIPLKIEAGATADFELRFYDYNDVAAGTCLMLEDKVTNETFDIREQDVLVRELIETSNDDRFKITVQPMLQASLVSNVACFGEANGKLEVANLTGVPTNFALYDVLGELVNFDMVEEALTWDELPAGAYTIREYIASAGCASVFAEVVITEPEQIVANFNISDTYVDLAEHTGEVTFTNNATGATNFVWFFEDNGEYVYTKNASHTYTTAGKYEVILLAQSADLNCVAVKTDTVEVIDKASNIEEVVDNKFTVNYNEELINLNINLVDNQNVEIQLIDMQGKRISETHLNGISEKQITLQMPEVKGMYMLKIKGQTFDKHIKIMK